MRRSPACLALALAGPALIGCRASGHHATGPSHRRLGSIVTGAPTTTPPTDSAAVPSTTVPTTASVTTPTTASTRAPSTEPALRTTCPSAGAAGLSLHDQVAQLLMASVPFNQVDGALTYTADVHVGGVAFFGVPPADVGTATRSIRAAAPGPAPFLAVDEEGGRVQRLGGLLTVLPSAQQMAATETPDQVQAEARNYASGMRGLGFDMDLAPVLDVSVDGGAIIGDRSFGATPGIVTRYSLAFAHGLQDGGVLPVVKHFPGHGRASGDSHDLTVQTPPLDALAAFDLLPFRAAVADRVPVVMVGHLDVPGLTGGLPASLSPPAVDGLLRHDLGYDGLVMTDSLEMEPVLQVAPDAADAAERSIRAGSDLVLLPMAANVAAVADQLTVDVGSDRLPRADLDRAVRHVAAAKALVGDWPNLPAGAVITGAPCGPG